VTGKLAEPALRRTVADLAGPVGFDFSISVLPITVAALTTTPWVARHLSVAPEITRVVLPGLCGGELAEIQALTPAPVERGPKDLRDLPEFFGQTARFPPPGYGKHDITILAEINQISLLSYAQIVERARQLHQAGADIIDLGLGDGGAPWSGIRTAVRLLSEQGLRVSIDSFNPQEIEWAVSAGAELVLSVNRTNREEVRGLGCEVVAVPDGFGTLDGLDETVQMLKEAGVPFRIDPILEPIGFGLATSLGRYLEVRRRYPDAEILMGVGNLTELTGVDSAGVNVLLLGFCQELCIRSVLTTEVINWCRSSVRELALARRLVYHACKERMLSKHLEPDLVMLRDPKLYEFGDQGLRELAARVTDRNFRLFAERELLHIISAQGHLQGTDPFELFRRMLECEAIEPAHAFYLGYEMAKAVTALTLGKNYVQDQALRWGFLSVPELSHRDRAQPGDVGDAEKP
jgi:dihydropteroate synthase-like protein